MTKKQAERHLAHLARRREQYAAKKAARTPRKAEQLALFAVPAARVPTKKERAEIDQEAKNLGRAWIKKIRASMGD
jgi:hypothetical protein